MVRWEAMGRWVFPRAWKVLGPGRGAGLRLRLAHKVFGAMLLVLALTAVVGQLSLNELQWVGRKSEAMATHWTPALFLASELHYLIFQHRSLVEQMVSETDPEALNQVRAGISTTMTALTQRLEEYRRLPLTAEEQQALATVQERLQDYAAEVDKMVAAKGQAEAGGVIPVRSTRFKFLALDQAIRTMKTQLADQTRAEAGSVVQSYQRSARTIPLVTASALVAGLVAAFLLSRMVSGPLQSLARASRQVAAGRLDGDPVLVRTGDEVEDLAAAFNGMVTGLAALVREVAATVQDLSHAAADLSAQSEQAAHLTQSIVTAAEASARGAGQQSESITEVIAAVGQLDRSIDYVARGATEQAAALNEIVATVQEMSQALEQIAGSADGVLAASRNSEVLVERSAATVLRTCTGMDQIRASVQEYAQLIRDLGRRSAQIGDILKVITDISDQTNLLALNAAIEAARAGEHGRGFAVVAEEIRKLAEGARRSAQEIREMVNWIRHHTDQAVAAMEVSVREVESGTRLAAEAKQDLDQVQVAARETVERSLRIAALTRQIQDRSRTIQELIHNVAAVAQENTAASEEMAASSHDVHQRMTPIGDITMQAAATAREVHTAASAVSAVTERTARAAQQLAHHAAKLTDLISRFRI